MTNHKGKVLCLDFDGVIHEYSSGWQGEDVIPDPPVPGAMEFLCRAVKHFDVVIYSSRSKSMAGRLAMQKAIERWLDAEGWDWQVTQYLTFAVEKPPAFLTIDDRAICFTGTFPDPQDLLNFEPWNKTTNTAFLPPEVTE